MHDAASRRHPLQIAFPEPCASAQGVGMIDEAMTGDRYCLETTMRVLGKARHPVAVIHAPTVLATEILTDITSSQARLRSHFFIPRRIGVIVVNAE